MEAQINVYDDFMYYSYMYIQLFVVGQIFTTTKYK
jgi:hypothetical protein